MPSDITCEFQLNCPAPDVARIAGRLGELYDGVHPLSAYPLAKDVGVSETAITAVLLRAERAGMVRYVEGRGWIPLNTQAW